MIDLESLPEMGATAFDDINTDDMIIPKFKTPKLQESYKNYGMLALPLSARLPKPMGNQMIAGMNAMTMALRSIRNGKIRESMKQFREANRTLKGIEDALRDSAGKYGAIYSKQTNPELANLDFRSEATGGEDKQLLDMLNQQPGNRNAVTGRMDELSHAAAQLQFNREKLKLDIIKTMIDARKALKPATTDDIVNLDRVNRDRVLSGLAPMSLEEFVSMKANLRANDPTSAREYQMAQDDPGYNDFLTQRRGQQNEGPASIKEYEYAKTQGYKGSFVDFKKEMKGGDDFEAEFERRDSPGTQGDPAIRAKIQELSGSMNPEQIQSFLEEKFNAGGGDKYNPAMYKDMLGGGQKGDASKPQRSIVGADNKTATEGAGIRSDIVSRIRAGDDPQQVYMQLMSEFQRTGDPSLNPSLYLQYFPKDTFRGDKKDWMQGIGTFTLPAGVGG